MLNPGSFDPFYHSGQPSLSFQIFFASNIWHIKHIGGLPLEYWNCIAANPFVAWEFTSPPLLLRGTPPQGDPPVKKYENPGPLFLSGQPLRNSILIGVLFCDQLLSMGLCLKSELLALLFLFTLPTCLASSGSTSLNNNLYNLLLRNPT